MATRFLHKGLNAENELGDKVPFSFDRNKNLAAKLYNGAGTVEDRFVPLGGLEKVTADKTLTYSDHGKTIVFDSTTSLIVTLPATKAGITYTFTVEQLVGSGDGHGIDLDAADQFRGNGVTPADGTAIQCSAATDRIGDSITVVGDGELGWYITSVSGTWALDT